MRPVWAGISVGVVILATFAGVRWVDAGAPVPRVHVTVVGPGPVVVIDSVRLIR